MSWHRILHALPLLTINDVDIFAPPREMEAAIASYNRALVNLRHDSADIAQITLRKLVITYPLFGPASLLYGACLLENGHLDASAEILDRARLAGLKGQETILADSLTAAIIELQPTNHSAASIATKSAAARPVTSRTRQEMADPSALTANYSASSGLTTVHSPGAASVLEKTSRPARTRMASRREVEHVLRQGDRPEQQVTTIISEKAPRERLEDLIRIAAIATIVIALVGLGLWLVPRIQNANRQKELPSDAQRLEFLMTQLESLSSDNPTVASLLADYNQYIAPPAPAEPTDQPTTETAMTAAPAETTAQDEPVTVPTPSATSQTSPTTPAERLAQVYSEYQAAIILGESDVVTGAEALLTLRQAAASLDPALRSPAVPLTVSELTSQIDGSLDAFRSKAAEALRLQGSAAYDSKDYQTSLDYYLRAFNLLPGAYGGGVAYYCGRNYQALGQFAQAKPYYEYVIEHYPSKEIASYAAVRIDEIRAATGQTTEET